MKKWLIATILFLIVSFAFWVVWKIIGFGFFLLGIGISFFLKNVGIIVIIVVVSSFIYMKFGDRLLEKKMFNPKKLGGVNVEKEATQPIPSHKQLAAIHEKQGERVLILSTKPQPKPQLAENERHTQSVLANVAAGEIAGKPVVDDISAVATLPVLQRTPVDQSFLPYVKSLNHQQIKLLVNEVYDELQLKYNTSVSFGEMGAKEFVKAVLLIRFNPEMAHKVMVGIEKVYENKFTILQFSEYMDSIIEGSDIPYVIWRDTYNYIQRHHGWIKEHPCSEK